MAEVSKLGSILNNRGSTMLPHKTENDKMSTQHTSVRYAKNEYNKKIQANAGSTSFDHIDHQSGIASGTIPKLAVFRRELECTMRGVKTLWRDEKSAWVYMDGEYMTIGWIGYGDFQTSKNGASKYVVYSRTIRNMKYSDHNAQYHMRMAKNRDIALKAARGNLRGYAPDEVADAMRDKVRNPVNALVSTANTTHRAACKTIGLEYYGPEQVRTLDALQQLLKSGHTFINADFHKDLLATFASKKDCDRLSTDKLPMLFVNIFEKWGKHQISLCKIADVKNRFAPSSEHIGTYDTDNAPEDIVGKVAVMSMCADEQFVEDVGFKVDSRAFYFYIEDVTL